MARSGTARFAQGAALACLCVAPAMADKLDMNKWEDVVTLRIQDGATLSQDCSKSWCDSITTLPPDQYGTVRLTIEATGNLAGRWECTIDRKFPDMRSCSGFWPEQPWRLDQRGADGHWHLLKVGTFEEINAREKVLWAGGHVAPAPDMIPAPALRGAEVSVSGLSLGALQEMYLKFDGGCRGGSDDSDGACNNREAVSRAIYKAGYCIAYPQYTWHRCGPKDTKPW